MSVLDLARSWERPRLPVGGVATFAVGTLLAAGAIHICAILLVPVLARSDGWSRLVPYAGEERFTEIPSSGTDGVAGLDPLFVTGACRLNLREAPAAVTVDARDRFWSLALYDPKGVIVFSLNDRTAIEGRLDMIVADPAQNAKLTRAPAAQIEQTLVTESPSEDLIALLRLFAPTRSALRDARRILGRAECLPDPSILAEQVSGG
jgi:uncharacterized membrane protein